MTTPFPTTPSIILSDPLARFLGAGDGVFHYTFEDAVKLSGHACPTVAGAYLMVIRALQSLYGEEVPIRGSIRITMPEAVDQGVNGPISQVFTLLTGAAAENGFHGLAGQFQRDGLIQFDPTQEGYQFQRIDSGKTVWVRYDASAIGADPIMSPLMQQALQGETAAVPQFQRLWRERVIRILQDAGKQTITVEEV